MLADPHLNHDDLRRWRACARRFWLHRRRSAANDPAAPAGDDPAADASAEAAVVHGPAPGDALRATFPGAVGISAPGTPAEWAHAVRDTAARLSERRMHQEGRALFGACLAGSDGAQVCIDVLTQGEHGLRLFKVRYATVADEADVDVVALWAHVAARGGLRVQSVGLLLVDTEFTYPGHGCYAGLFREVDLGPVLGSRPVASWLAAMQACDRGPQPQADTGAQCTQHGGCDFIDHCRAHGDAQGPAHAKAAGQASLEIVGRELAAELRHEGHADLRSVPEHRLADARHRRALRAIQQGAPVLEPAVAALMQAQGYPRRTLRFDTIGFAVPVWAGTQPYQVLPFQWTCDVEPAPGQLLRKAFLADARGDPRRAFAQTLLQALGDSGPVFAYNAGFERNRIRELALRFDDLAAALEALLPRIVDLFQIARTHYYHPLMRGSWSFKSVFGAIAPELHAARFECDGEPSSQAAFARSLQRGLDAATLQRLQDALRSHGQRQTEALRRMVALFEGAAPASPARAGS
ncbi:DUF2779 domain-containing protein [Methylibium sp.]|uniref:DUF2779 domain-containing protein n=1 Tax=Methylibium sp. TaxID=2067992 RepID=UPI003D0B4A77